MDFEKDYDVAVIGGGVAGIAAAVQAAREGKKTVLIEKTILPGGLATTGLVYIYLPLCDGNGHQVSFGITEELIRRSLKYGPGDIPAHWDEGNDAPEEARFRTPFSPAAYMLALDEFLVENDVDVWYDTLVCGASIENGRLAFIECENESGRGIIRAKCFVDASGSCIAARRAGIPCHDEINFLSIWAVEYNKNRKDAALDPLAMHFDGVPWDPEKAGAENLFRGISGKSVSEFTLKSRLLLRKYYEKEYAAGNADRKSLFAVKVPAMPQFRKLYSLDAAYVLDSDENNRRFEDSIGLAGDWRKAGPVWEIPYRTLIPANRTGGYLAAGRCTGARNDAWEITRVIPVAAMTGQVAGLAASMSIDAGVEPYDLDPIAIQGRLRTLGFKIHLSEIGL